MHGRGGRPYSTLAPLCLKLSRLRENALCKRLRWKGSGARWAWLKIGGTLKRSVSLSPNCCKLKKNQKGGFPVIFSEKPTNRGFKQRYTQAFLGGRGIPLPLRAEY